MSGFFVTFEGGEGSGKTTQIALLAESLRRRGDEVVTTREPGGSEGADAVRQLILSGAAEVLGPEIETILFQAARIDHIAAVIAPALAAGRIVLCDRFYDSTRVYQGLAHVDPRLLDFLEAAALGDLRPDLTIVLDIPAATGLARASSRRGGAPVDRFEREAIGTHEARRQAFLAIAAAEDQRCVVVDATRTPEAVAVEIDFLVRERLECRHLEMRGRTSPPAVAAASRAAGAGRA
ncbi:MAG: dTMP kinase, partial [Rhizobiaceae bacterium]|nr:dTMP kinase [Rhizobiaceae bacterium]